MKSAISPGNSEQHEPENTVFVASVLFASPRFADKLRSAAQCSGSSNTVSFHPSKTTIVASIYQVTSLTNAWTTPEYGASRSVVQRQLIRLISFSGTSRSSLEAESLAARATDAYDYTAGDLSPYAGMLNCSPFARRLAI